MAYFTQKQIEQANSVDLVSMLKERGEILMKDGHEYRWGKDHSVTIRGNKWYQHNGNYGGCAIDFLKEFQGLNFTEAVQQLMNGYSNGNLKFTVQEEKAKEPVPFCLPKHNHDMRRLYAYLVKSRCIDAAIISDFVKGGLLYEDAYHNIIFCARDASGTIVNAQKKGTCSYGQSYRGTVEGSDMGYSFCHVGVDEELYVFEAPIDMLAYITMNQEHWKDHSYLALGGGSEHPLLCMLKLHKNLRTVYIATDHDVGGIEIAERLYDVLADRKYKVHRILPEKKDFDEDLKKLHGLEVKPAVEHAGQQYLERISKISQGIGSFKDIMECYAAALYNSEVYENNLEKIFACCINNSHESLDRICSDFRLYRNSRKKEVHDRQLQKVINEMKHQYYTGSCIQMESYEQLAKECLGALVCMKMQTAKELDQSAVMERMIHYE